MQTTYPIKDSDLKSKNAKIDAAEASNSVRKWAKGLETFYQRVYRWQNT